MRGIRRKIATGLAIASGFLLGINSVAVSPAAAATGGVGSISVQTERWNPVSRIHVTGDGFAGNESVKLVLKSTRGLASTNSAGHLSTDITIPNVAPGNYPLTATGLTSGVTATYYFQVQPFNPWAAPSAYYVAAGKKLYFAGHRFGNTEHVDVYLAGRLIRSGHTDVLGEFTQEGPYVVPLTAAGTVLHFTIKGRRSLAEASFDVTVANAFPSGTTTTTRPQSTTTSTSIPPTTTSTTSTSVPTTSPTTTPTTSPTTVPATTPPTTSSPTTVPATTPPTTQPPVVERQVALESSSLTPALPGQSLWEAVSWTGSNIYDACDFAVTASIDGGAPIIYPSNQSNSTLSKTTTLPVDATDYAAIRVRIPDSAGASGTSVDLTATYLPCGDGAPANAQSITLHRSATIPTAVNGNGAFTQDTNQVGPVSSGSIQPVQVYFTGNGPGLTNFQVQVTDTGGLRIIYPAGRTYTTPNKETYIEVTDTDYVGLRIDAVDNEPGFYVLQITTTYGTSRVQVPGTVAVQVV